MTWTRIPLAAALGFLEQGTPRKHMEKEDACRGTLTLQGIFYSGLNNFAREAASQRGHLIGPIGRRSTFKSKPLYPITRKVLVLHCPEVLAVLVRSTVMYPKISSTTRHNTLVRWGRSWANGAWQGLCMSIHPDLIDY